MILLIGKMEVFIMYSGKEVGLRIKKLRRQMNMTQTQFAEKLCYASERQVQRIENGEVVCPTDRLIEIAFILGVSTDYILFGNEAFCVDRFTVQ